MPFKYVVDVVVAEANYDRNPWWLFCNFQASEFDYVSCVGIVMADLIQLTYFGDENLTLMDVEKLCSKPFFNGSSGLAFVDASPKLNSISSCSTYDV
jgi:hypothetical protein